MPLNPQLHDALVRVFGHVRISNEGCWRTCTYAPVWNGGDVRLRARDTSAGEYYAVNCPFCRDQRGRLYINHEFGERDENTGNRNLHLAICFNDDCLSDWSIRMELLHMIENKRRLSLPNRAPSGEVEIVPRPTEMPGARRPLYMLPEDHPARVYMLQRGFDLREIGSAWGVGFCFEGEQRPRFRSRLLYPIYAPPRSRRDAGRIQFMGWQARAVDPGDLPKYLTSQGTPKSRLLYGLPEAIQSAGPLVVVEGATDVWRLGSNGVALFGKHLSADQAALLARYSPGRKIALLLDADADESVEVAQRRLRDVLGAARYRTTVVTVSLPAGRDDPADCDRDEVWQCISDALGAPHRPVVRELLGD